MLSRLFGLFSLCRGFCHRTESDLFLFRLSILLCDLITVLKLFILLLLHFPLLENGGTINDSSIYVFY